ncbi:hypothetical protein PPTG_24465 [Phytophthora nicotianae INRA-310]|uniref:Uncharacterized protein n=1 Tax=Phytophthora nicotianae (strain INRA-310) TaxID=761204 RepID=W2PG52_PHYN3|nr:hypothetical protein PPTG_24465 [Phytophthora nicotianae INRA-310]ETM99193.1 hypothetical protein PPTG_24465 [Phytophthora nicotianae INRA-310]
MLLLLTSSINEALHLKLHRPTPDIESIRMTRHKPDRTTTKARATSKRGQITDESYRESFSELAGRQQRNVLVQTFSALQQGKFNVGCLGDNVALNAVAYQLFDCCGASNSVNRTVLLHHLLRSLLLWWSCNSERGVKLSNVENPKTPRFYLSPLNRIQRLHRYMRGMHQDRSPKTQARIIITRPNPCLTLFW